MEPRIDRHSRARAGWMIAALAVAGLAVAPVQSEKPASTASNEAVADLVRTLKERQLTAIAAKDPGEPGRYVAAMYFPGVQLLVISARTHAPEYIDAQIAAKGYDAAYAALQQGIPESKLFVHDMGADGLRGSAGGTADIVYTRGTETRVLDGDHEGAGMSANEYRKLVNDIDRRYADMLRLLVQSARAGQSLPTSL